MQSNIQQNRSSSIILPPHSHKLILIPCFQSSLLNRSSIFEFSFSMAFVLSFSLQLKKTGPDRPWDGEVMIVLCDGSRFGALRSKTYGTEIF